MKSQIFTITLLFILTLATAFIFIQTSEAAKIVAIWLLDEGKGKEIKDASGNGHTQCRQRFVQNPDARKISC